MTELIEAQAAVVLLLEQRQDLVAGLVHRAMSERNVSPVQVARWATASDEELLAIWRAREQAGDQGATELLARHGLSACEIEVVLKAQAKAPGAAPRIVSLLLTTTTVDQYRLDHAVAKDLTDFASLSVAVKIPYRLKPMATIAAGTAVLATNAQGQATVQFAFQQEVPGEPEEDIYTRPCGLENLCNRIRRAILDKELRIYVGCSEQEADELLEPGDHQPRERHVG
jgi:hypothetical protein